MDSKNEIDHADRESPSLHDLKQSDQDGEVDVRAVYSVSNTDRSVWIREAERLRLPFTKQFTRTKSKDSRRLLYSCMPLSSSLS